MKPAITFRSQLGVTLVELLVGLAVGMVILAGAVTLMAKISFSGLENTRSVRLNQQMRAALDFMARDIQRAGYMDSWGAGGADLLAVYTSAVLDEMTAFGLVTLGGACADTDGDTAVECSCIIFSYDLQDDGARDASDVFGFRLNGTAIEGGTSDGGTPPACDGAGTWRDISENSVTVTALTFELEPDDTPDPDWPVGSLPVPIIYEIEGDGDGVCESTEVCSSRRKINVEVEGELTSDAAITASLREQIKLKNDHYYTEP